MAGVLCRTFSYCMIEEAPQYLNLLWASEGEVMYQSGGFTTDWHGEFRQVARGVLQLRFHYRGDTTKLRATTVVEVRPGIYRGRDYKRRLIEMRAMDDFVYYPDGDGEGWIQILDID